jgi:hypothetical protein
MPRIRRAWLLAVRHRQPFAEQAQFRAIVLPQKIGPTIGLLVHDNNGTLGLGSVGRCSGRCRVRRQNAMLKRESSGVHPLI